MKKIFFSLAFAAIALYASNFSNAIRAYKSQNYKEAKEFFELAVEEGSVQAKYFLGLFYLNGMGTQKDLDKAEKFFLEAKKIGNARANCYLAQIYLEKGNANIKKIKKLLKEGLQSGARECSTIAQKYNINLN
ncbi:tetratricopeptide repeat protein [Nitrosophilus alvini]|uniref:tetratricopeptide repeat protein n=1 Tax=Nitrosophilus alvini TaxID=2714855 RepID=UPI00190C4C3E|nr:sel1 repeat family protein [Nitrosophilus alvini]